MRVNFDITMFLHLLTVLFIGLKLTKLITWTWVVVLSPLWIPLVVIIIGGLIYALIIACKQK